MRTVKVRSIVIKAIWSVHDIGHDGIKITIGKALLLNLGWKGEMILQDGHPSYKRLKVYTEDLARSRVAEAGVG